MKFLFEKVTEKIDKVEYNELTALMYAINILVMKFNYNVSWNLRKLLVEKFPNELSIEKKADIPTICFSLSSIVEKDIDIEKEKER